MKKIAFIGAGSLQFTSSCIRDLLTFPAFEECEFALMDTNADNLKNITLSTQRTDLSGYDLIDIVEKYNGILIPAHVFTPHKSYYGNCTDRLENIFKEKFR